MDTVELCGARYCPQRLECCRYLAKCDNENCVWLLPSEPPCDKLWPVGEEFPVATWTPAEMAEWE